MGHFWDTINTNGTEGEERGRVSAVLLLGCHSFQIGVGCPFWVFKSLFGLFGLFSRRLVPSNTLVRKRIGRRKAALCAAPWAVMVLGVVVVEAQHSRLISTML